MKLFIYAKTKEGAWGGGNQFLKGLQREFANRGIAAQSIEAADAVLFNSYQDLPGLIKHFFLNHRQVRIHRLGPVMSLHRSGIKWKLVDYAVAFVASICADAVVFQSHWSFRQARRLGFLKRNHVSIIPNAVDSSIFFPPQYQSANSSVRLIYTSWSANKKKGFETLKWLDNNLDFSKYQMTFIGNTPTSFNNIRCIPPLPSNQLANELRVHDIFISPTEDDACSNALIEALACGLPAVALDSGGNAELIRGCGELYTDTTSMEKAIDRVAQNLPLYRSRISVQSIAAVADKYIELIRGTIKSS